MDDLDQLVKKIMCIPLTKASDEIREEIKRFIKEKVAKCFTCESLVIGGYSVCEDCTQKHLKDILESKGE